MHTEKENNHKPKVLNPDATVGAIIIDFKAKHQGQVLFWLVVGAQSCLGRLSSDQTAQLSQAGSQRLQFT